MIAFWIMGALFLVVGLIVSVGAQPGVEAFYEKNGCQKSLQSYIIEKRSE